HLPVALENVVIYAGSGPDAKWYSLGDAGRLVPEVPATVANIHAPGIESMNMRQWLEAVPAQSGRSPTSQRAYNPAASKPTVRVMKELLFSQFAAAGTRDNSLRYLDQAWRLPHKEEVILFGQIAREER